jgi:hypothetical protein
MKIRLAGLLSLLLSLGFARAALANFPEEVPDTVQIDIGGTFASVHTEASLTGSGSGIGASVNLEEVLGLDSNQSTWRLDGSWRITKRQHIDFGYFQLNRSGEKKNTENFTWGDYTFHKGNQLSGSFDSEFPYAAWRWDFLQDPHVHISGSAGVSYTQLKASMTSSGTVTTPDGPRSGTFSGDESLRYPVPLLGLQVDWALAKRWEVEWYSRFIFVNLSSVSGSMNESAVRLKWYFLKNVGAALGYDHYDINLKYYKDGSKTLTADYAINGWSAYLSLAF